jgi:hypothetical protein
MIRKEISEILTGLARSMLLEVGADVHGPDFAKLLPKLERLLLLHDDQDDGFDESSPSRLVAHVHTARLMMLQDLLLSPRLLSGLSAADEASASNTDEAVPPSDVYVEEEDQGGGSDDDKASASNTDEVVAASDVGNPEEEEDQGGGSRDNVSVCNTDDAVALSDIGDNEVDQGSDCDEKPELKIAGDVSKISEGYSMADVITLPEEQQRVEGPPRIFGVPTMVHSAVSNSQPDPPGSWIQTDPPGTYGASTSTEKVTRSISGSARCRCCPL